MKKSIGIMGVAILSLSATTLFAQETPAQTPPVQTAPPTHTWEAKNNPTVDSINAKYRDKMLPARPALTNADIFPAVGKFESASNPDAANVEVMLDEQNKGTIWIVGLPQGKIKAMLRKSPAIYKIPAQKTEEGKEVAEGTLIFDKETNTLSISIGKEYNSENPSAAFAVPVIGDPAPIADEKVKVKDGTVKKKTKTKVEPQPWVYTGTKVVTETVAN